MKKENGFLSFLKNPGGIFLIFHCLLTVGTVACSIFFVAVSYTGFVSYIVYVLAAISFGYSVYLIVRFAGTIKKSTIEKLKKREITRRFVENYGFRTIVFSVVSFTINVGYAVFYGIFGIVVHSVWYGALAGYYIFLSVARAGVLAGGYRASKRANGNVQSLYEYKLRIFRACGIFLLVLELALAPAIAQMVLSDSSATHGEIMAIASAAYAFYKIVLAVANLFKAKKIRDPLVQSLRNIGLTDALVSLFALQTTLVALYSEGEGDMAALNIAVGAVVCLATICMGIFMIVRAGVLLKRRRFIPARAEESAERTETSVGAVAENNDENTPFQGGSEVL